MIHGVALALARFVVHVQSPLLSSGHETAVNQLHRLEGWRGFNETRTEATNLLHHDARQNPQGHKKIRGPQHQGERGVPRCEPREIVRRPPLASRFSDVRAGEGSDFVHTDIRLSQGRGKGKGFRTAKKEARRCFSYRKPRHPHANCSASRLRRFRLAPDTIDSSNLPSTLSADAHVLHDLGAIWLYGWQRKGSARCTSTTRATGVS